MIDIGIYEKIKALKAKYLNEHPDAMRQLNEWEKRLQELDRLDGFVNNQTTKDIIAILKARLKQIFIDRATTKNHTPETLKTLDTREDELRYCLSLLQPTYESDIQSLQQLIDSELT